MPPTESEMRAQEIAHVLFIDIVGYSRLPLDEAVQVLRQLQEVISRTEQFQRAKEREQLVRLPTGDGMALVFFSDPTAPVKCALEIDRAVKDHPDIKFRMGVHSGPAHRFTDVSGKSNVAGAAINIAQRVMDFGDAGHILISKTAADALKHLAEWEELIHDLGEVEVKNGVKVHILNFYTDELGNPAIPTKVDVPLSPNKELDQHGQPERDNQSSRLRYAIENKFPYPIASTFYQLGRLDNWQAEIQQVSNVLERTLEHLAILAMTEYFSGKAREQAINDSISDKLGRAVSLGTWANIVREVLTFLKGQPHKAFMPELFDCYFETRASAPPYIQKLVDELIPMRNAFAHPKKPPTHAEHRKFKGKAVELLQALAFLKDYPLVSVKFSESQEGVKSHACHLHMGFHDTFEQVSLQCDLDLEKTRVAMLSPRAGEIQYLHPFYLLRECAEKGCGAVHLFHFERADKNRTEYVSTNGHRLRDERAAVDFKSLMQSSLSARLRSKAKYLYLRAAESKWHKLPAGQRIDSRYEVVEWLRRGGMADVYKVKEVGTDSYCALKLLPFQFLNDQKMVHRFRLEAEQASKLKHENITNIFEYGEALVDHYLVMELADGWPTAEGQLALDVGELPKPLDEVTTMAIIKQACDGISFIHQNGVVHRDIKPGNLLLFENSRVKITDFGIARSRESITLTLTGLTMGTPEYMSPEQAEGKRELSAATDIYSLGIIMYEMLTGEPPFKRNTPMATAVAHIHETVPPPTDLNPSISDSLQHIVMKCLEKEPEERFSARELYQAIDEYERSGAAPAVAVGAAHMLAGHEGPVRTVAFSPNGALLASGGADMTIKLWDARTGAFKRALKGHEDEITALAFSPDGATLMSGSSDRMVRLWDVGKGVLKRTLIGFRNPSVDTVAFSPDGKLAASGGEFGEDEADDEAERTGEIILWDTETLKLKRSFTGHDLSVSSIAFSPDSKLLVSGSWDKKLKIWDALSRELRLVLEGHKGAVYAVAVSPDGRLLASGSEDLTIKLWDVKTGRLMKTLEGHSARILSLAFSPDGETLASGSGEHQRWGEVKLWNKKTGEIKRRHGTLRGHNGAVTSVSFSPDGLILASGSLDAAVGLWRVDEAAKVERNFGRPERTNGRPSTAKPQKERKKRAASKKRQP